MVPEGQVRKTDEPWPRLNGATNTGLTLQLQNIRPTCGLLSQEVAATLAHRVRLNIS
jgi:hypothetical protein